MKKITFFLASFLLVFAVSGQSIVQKQSLQTPQVQSLTVAPVNTDLEQLSQQLANQAPRTPTGHIRCFTTENEMLLRTKHPERLNDAQFESWISEKILEADNNSNQKKATRNIPVVVHVIHNGDAIGSGENITDAQVLSQIDVLNKDFSATNTDFGNVPAAFQSVAASMDIQFCLAQTDPNGQPTTGIDRVDYGTASFGNAATESMKAATSWDPTKYFNIWVLNFGGDLNGVLGYAQFPSSSGLSGLNTNGGAANTDGVAIGYNYFGTTGAVSYPFNKGRTATHEIGHCFGLRHIWGEDGSGGCSADDYVTDTPNQSTANYSCPSHPSASCSNGGDMFMNYMDYVDDACMYAFTAGQKLRMDAVLQNSPRRASLLTSTVCNVAAITADFVADVTTINVGGSVNFTDQSVSPNTLNSWNWTFSGGTPSSFVGQTPPAISYAAAGQYDVTLTVGDNASGTDTKTRTQYINVITAGACDTLLNIADTDTLKIYGTANGFIMGLNEYDLTPTAELYTSNSPYAYVTSADVYLYGVTDGGNGATVTLNVWSENTGALGTLLSSTEYSLADIATTLAGNGGQGLMNFPLDVPANVGTGNFFVGLSYQSYDINNGDALGIVHNSDLDPTPNSTYTTYSGSFMSYENLFGDPYSAYISPHMSLAVPTADITTNTTTICASETVDFDATNSTNAVSYNWVFNGGSPTSSTNTTETVTYASAGTPRAYLIANGACGEIAIDSVDITVNTSTTPTFTQVGPYCVGDTPATLPTTSNNGVSGTWDAAISTASAGTTTYTFIPSGGGCATAATMDVVVNANTTPTFTQVGPYCVGDTPVTLPTTSNNGVTGTWDAAISTASAGTTTYTFTPSGGCSSPVTMDVVVNANTTPTFTQVGPYCVGDTPATLPTTSNNSVSGTWDATISTASAGTVTYTFTPSGGCATTATMDVVVNANVTPTFTQMGPYCIGSTPGTLPTTSNNGVSGTWDAAISTASAGTTTYTFTPTGGCATTATMDVVVSSSITPTFTQVGPYCVGDTPATLPTTSNNSVSGTWDAAISTSSAGTVTYTFTPSGGCATTATMDVVVNASVTPTFTQVGPYCTGDTPATLPTTSNNGVTGTWDAMISTASAGTVTYTFTPSGGCATTATMDVVVNASVTPTFTQVGPYCVGDTPATLPTTSNNSVSGTWDAAISTSSAGTTTYTFTPTGGGCTTTATMDVVVNTNTTPTFSLVGPYCVGDTPDVLPTTSINGVTGTWDAAISTSSAGTTTYTFTPSGGCSGSVTMDVVVNTCVGINEINTESILIYPNPVSETLTIETPNLEIDQVKLINILGETLVSSKIVNSITKMNVSKFSMGVYFVQLIDNNGQVIRTEKVSIK
jgi:PKD repeat protein